MECLAHQELGQRADAVSYAACISSCGGAGRVVGEMGLPGWTNIAMDTTAKLTYMLW